MSTSLLKVAELVVKVNHFVEVVKWRVVHIIVSIDVLFITILVLVIIVRIQVDVGIFFILTNDGLAMILDLSLFSLLLALELLLSDLDAFATEVGERLDDVGVVVFDAVGHVTVDEEGSESENESLDLEVLPNLAHLLEDELEEIKTLNQVIEFVC